jgi:hypothetical protein
VVSKFQQAAEKALKGAILALVPGASGLVFSPHSLLSEQNRLPGDRRFRAVLERIATVHGGVSLRATLKELEQCASSGLRRAELDADGNLVSLPLNTEYPFLEKGGTPIAPMEAWRGKSLDVIRYARAVEILFRHLKGIQRLSNHLSTHPGKPIVR